MSIYDNETCTDLDEARPLVGTLPYDGETSQQNIRCYIHLVDPLVSNRSD